MLRICARERERERERERKRARVSLMIAIITNKWKKLNYLLSDSLSYNVSGFLHLNCYERLFSK